MTGALVALVALPGGLARASDRPAMTPANQTQWNHAVQRRLASGVLHGTSPKPRTAGAGTELLALQIRLVVAPDGRILKAGIKSSLGRATLDQEVLRAIGQMPPLPAFSPDMPRKPLTLSLPMELQRWR